MWERKMKGNVIKMQVKRSGMIWNYVRRVHDFGGNLSNMSNKHKTPFTAIKQETSNKLARKQRGIIDVDRGHKIKVKIFVK